MSEISWKKKTLLAATALLFGWIGYSLWNQTASYETGPVADFSWTQGTAPHQITLEIVTPENRPVSWAFLEVITEKGVFSGTCDVNGEATFQCEGDVMVAIRANRRILASRQFATLLGSPSLKNGLDLKVVVKNPAAFGAMAFLNLLRSEKDPTYQPQIITKMRIPPIPGLQEISIPKQETKTE